MCGDVTLEFCGVTLTVFGILNVMHIIIPGTCVGSDHKSMAYSELSGLELLESYPWRRRRMVWDIQVWRLGTIMLVLQGMLEA